LQLLLYQTFFEKLLNQLLSLPYRKAESFIPGSYAAVRMFLNIFKKCYFDF
jgi:hypothetical protein